MKSKKQNFYHKINVIILQSISHTPHGAQSNLRPVLYLYASHRHAMVCQALESVHSEGSLQVIWHKEKKQFSHQQAAWHRGVPCLFVWAGGLPFFTRGDTREDGRTMGRMETPARMDDAILKIFKYISLEGKEFIPTFVL